MHVLKCDLCSKLTHRNCTLFTIKEYNDFVKTGNPAWTCRICAESIFPFNHIVDNDVYYSSLLELTSDCRLFGPDYAQTKIFDPFDLNDEKDYIPCTDINPDSYYYNDLSLSIQQNSNYYHENSFNQSFQRVFYDNDTLSLMHLNIRSIPSNLTKLIQYLSNLNVNFDIIGISETWLNETNKDIYNLNGYNHVPLVRQDRIHGGVSLFISASISNRILNEISIINKDIECFFIEIELNGVRIHIGIIYRTPDADVKNFYDYLVNILESLKPHNQSCYLMGDYNIDLLKHFSHNPTSGFLDLMFSNSFIPLINKPTRVTHTTATLLDNIYTNIYINIYLTGILTTDISDHYIIFHIAPSQFSQQKDHHQLIRLINSSNLEKYTTAIQNHDWSLVNHHNLCQTAFSYFSETLKGIFHDAFPVIKVKQRYRNILPWLTQGLKNAIKHKNKLYKIFMKYDTSFNKITCTQYKNKLTTILRKTEKEYYKCLLEINKNNFKKTCSIIRSVINDCKPSKLNESFLYNNSIITDKNEVSNKFNDYFVNVGKTLAAQIPKSGPSFHKYLPEANKECIILIPTDEREIRNIFLNIRNSAPGYDGISLKFIYPVIDILVTPLTYITNLSLIEGIFPPELKITQVLPLYKNDDPMLFNNYRPISLLPFFSKFFERLMYNRLIDFIEKQHLLYQFQFDFRKNHSTFMTLVILLEKITEALGSSEFAICILIDFRKAFDTVEHNILLQKLYHYGIRGNAPQWFNSYLSNIYQYVNYNNTSSDMKLITCGVPQGSILGPLLFLLYINDI